ncbi:MAG: hypothetical protein WC655_23635 [Candidatus Hydrogenedentales bacterium]|jgi:hypothetical protein
MTTEELCAWLKTERINTGWAIDAQRCSEAATRIERLTADLQAERDKWRRLTALIMEGPNTIGDFQEDARYNWPEWKSKLVAELDAIERGE